VTLALLHDAAGLVVVDKPAGLLTIPGRDAAEPCAQHLLEQQLGCKLWVVHRIDRGTSGALAFARDASAHRLLSMAFEAGAVRKRYQAIVRGALTPPEGTIAFALAAGRKGKMRPAREGEADARPSETRYRTLRTFGAFSFVELEPLTGRQHQLRVHLAFSGHPLAVDPDYRGGDRVTARDLGSDSDAVVMGRTPLHCAAMALPLPGGEVRVEAPLAPDMARMLAWSTPSGA
jgi:RluA family pseudouridine synthase